jgi:hypothetical protein
MSLRNRSIQSQTDPIAGFIRPKIPSEDPVELSLAPRAPVCEHGFLTSQGHRYAQFQRALKTGNAHLALAAAAELRHVDLADALSLVLLIRDDDPLRYDRAAVRWLSRYTAEDRELHLAEARELVDMLAGVGRHDQVAMMRLERFLRLRGYEAEADRVA